MRKTKAQKMEEQARVYEIIRFYRDNPNRNKVILKGLTLAEAQAHCNSEDTHKLDKSGSAIWFDGYHDTRRDKR